jgi:hypothetical protein
MIRPAALCIALSLFVLFRAVSQENPAETSGSAAVDFFPVLSLYETVLSGEIFWRPDWPPTIPPDAFSFLSSGASAFILVMGGGDMTKELRTRRNSGGLLEEFPLFRGSDFFQVQTRFGGTGLIRGFTIKPQTEETWDILIAEYEDAFPSLVRITRGEALYLALIEYKGSESMEIWYDRDGNALAVFSYVYETSGGRLRRFTAADMTAGTESAETYHYDGMGNISAIDAFPAECSAVYVEKGRPRYWERPALSIPGELLPSSPPAEESDILFETPDSAGALSFERYAFQWNEEGLLIRFTGGSGGLDAAETDIRYDYVRNERGAWTERRSVPMIRSSGFLVPGQEERLLRRIEYPAP